MKHPPPIRRVLTALTPFLTGPEIAIELATSRRLAPVTAANPDTHNLIPSLPHSTFS
jgi:hypothetical protein